MGLMDDISEWIRDRKVSKANIQRRGVTYYKPSPVGGFVEPDIYNHGVVCSGGSRELRSEVIVNLCIAATNAGIPVIVLHQGDSVLTGMFRRVYTNHPAYIEAGTTGKHFDPLFDLNSRLIGKMIIDTAPSKYALTYDGKAYVDVLTTFLAEKGRTITLGGLYDCPHDRLPLLITAAAGNHSLTPEVVQSLQTGLAQGQREAQRVKAYLEELYDECCSLLPANRADYANCVTVEQAVKQKAVLCLDIVSDRNDLLLKLLAEQVQMLIRRRIPLFVILDDVRISDENAAKALCTTTRAAGYACAVTGDDLLSLCGGDEKLFSAILGNSSKWFIFHHGGLSAEKWSASFSKYQKIETTDTYGTGSGKGSSVGLSLFGFGWNRNSNKQRTKAYANKDEAVIRGEEIQKLSARGGIVYTADTREIAFLREFSPMQ